MLIRQDDLKRIRAGEVSVAFRRWKRPTVKAGGTLLTAVGQLAIESVEPVELEELTEADARAAGFEGVPALREVLEARDGQCYRIRLSYAGGPQGPGTHDQRGRRIQAVTTGRDGPGQLEGPGPGAWMKGCGSCRAVQELE